MIIPNALRTWALERALAYMSSRPHDFAIGPPDDRYLLRWIVGPWGIYERGSAPKNWWDGFTRKLPNLYLHRFRHDDEDRALHDHPWPSASLLLENSYSEVVFYPISEERIAKLKAAAEPRPTVKVFRPEGKLSFRRAADAHRVVLDKRAGRLGRTESVEVVTAFFTGFAVRGWGFHCPKGWIPWKNFVSDRDRGDVGAGCGD